MNTVRLFQGIALALLVVFVLPRPVAAQDETEADTIWVDGDKTIVVMTDEGRRFIIRSSDDDGPRVFFGSDDEGHNFTRFFDGKPGAFHFRSGEPKVMEFYGDLLDEEGQNFTVLSDYLDNLGNVWVDRLGDGSRIELGASMRERSEVMKLEMESRRLAQRARRAEGEERTRLEGELEEKLQEIFDRKQALQEERIDGLRGDLDDLLDKHNERSQNQREIIERRLRNLLGKEGKYDW